MAMNIPTQLKPLDITRYAQRAAQTEKIKPPIAYWCYYYIIDQIMSRGLAGADEECRTYAKNIMEKLEQIKESNENEAVFSDSQAAKAYVEQFGQDTFERADNAMRANKSSRQTADTLQAAITFLDLIQNLESIWGPPNPDIPAKIKFAKFHALRIAKAIKAGEDPNLTNPQPEPPPDTIELDPNDPEVQRINGLGQQPSVEEVPDEHHRIQPSLASQSNIDQSLHPSRAPSVPQSAGPTHPPRPPISSGAPSPISPDQPGTQATNLQGYFPQVASQGASAPMQQPHPQQPVSQQSPSVYQSSPPPSSQDPHGFYYQQQNMFQSPPAAQPAYQPSFQQGTPAALQPPHQPQMQPPPHFQTAQSGTPNPQQFSSRLPQAPQAFRDDEKAISEAQRHGRFAQSALNFDDVPTAVKEFMLALKALGVE